MKCYIVERTEQEALSLKEEALKKGLIKKAGEIKKFVHHYSGKTREQIYYYKIECEE